MQLPLRSNSIIGFPMSLLVRQLAFDPDGFLTRYPHPWLIWEPDGWTPPVSSSDQSLVETSHTPTEAGPLNGDPLCFPLKKGVQLRIGRTSENEVVVSDATVSRIHAQLDREGDAWFLTPLSTTEPTVVGDLRIVAGQRVKLTPGDTLELGGARLSWFDTRTLRARVSTVPLRMAGGR